MFLGVDLWFNMIFLIMQILENLYTLLLNVTLNASHIENHEIN